MRLMRNLAMTFVFAVASCTSVASACPLCKDSIPNEENKPAETADLKNPLRQVEAEASLPGGFNSSVYFMLSAFVGVLGFVGLTLYRGARSGGSTAASKQEDPDQASPSA